MNQPAGTCPSCRAPIVAGQRFCEQCGTTLSPAQSTAPPSSYSPPPQAYPPPAGGPSSYPPNPPAPPSYNQPPPYNQPPAAYPAQPYAQPNYGTAPVAPQRQSSNSGCCIGLVIGFFLVLCGGLAVGGALFFLLGSGFSFS
ncbi:MAG: zinc ribbon domain-containing protein [Dehalococcoidia bacterium]